jgi:hypothetical protein
MVDTKIRDLRGASRRRFMKWMGAVGAAFAVDRSRLLNFADDVGGEAFAGGMACAATNRSVHIVGGNGSLAWFQLLWPFVEIAQANNPSFAWHAPGEGQLHVGGDKPFYYGPEAPWLEGGQPKARRAVTAMMSGANETHTQTPVTSAVVAPNASLVATSAAIQRAVPTLLPVIGVGPVNLGAAPGAPSAANVPSAGGMVDLFNSAASQLILASQEDRELYETYYKAVVGLREGAKLPTWKRHLDVTKTAANVVGRNLGNQLTPTNADLTMYGVPTLLASQASAPAKTKLENLARTLITTAKAFKLNLTMNVQVALAPGASDGTFSDPHAAFDDMNALRATITALGTMLNAFYDDLASSPDPACSEASLADTVILTAHGDTPKTPTQASAWPDSTPGNANWVYVMSNGYLKSGWFGDIKANDATSGWDLASGNDVPGKPSAETATAAGAAIAYAVAKGDMYPVKDFYAGPDIDGVLKS